MKREKITNHLFSLLMFLGSVLIYYLVGFELAAIILLSGIQWDLIRLRTDMPKKPAENKRKDKAAQIIYKIWLSDGVDMTLPHYIRKEVKEFVEQRQE